MRKNAFSIASLLTEHMKRVRSASSCGSVIVVKSHCNSVLTNSRCQLRECFSRLAFEVRPELVTFSDDVSCGVELGLHVVHDLSDAQLVNVF